MRIFYLVPLLFVILFSCRSKYDTSKAIDVLPTDEITLDYRLKDLPFKVDDESAVANVSEYAGNSIGKSGYFVKEVQYLSNRNGNTGSNDNSSGSLTFVTSKKLSILNISTNKTEHSAPHTISNPLLLTNKNFTLIFNENGYFSFFDKDLNDVWSGKIGLSDLEFLKEKSEKVYWKH